jgi:hypothetical protein
MTIVSCFLFVKSQDQLYLFQLNKKRRKKENEEKRKS